MTNLFVQVTVPQLKQPTLVVKKAPVEGDDDQTPLVTGMYCWDYETDEQRWDHRWATGDEIDLNYFDDRNDTDSHFDYSYGSLMSPLVATPEFDPDTSEVTHKRASVCYKRPTYNAPEVLLPLRERLRARARGVL